LWAQVQTNMRTWVLKHRESIAWGLLVLVFAVLAFDWFFGTTLTTGRYLVTRLVYTPISFLVIAYVYLLATSRQQEVNV
jgi:Zn-dependent protease with chaperone function